jgi:hypothetical protein
MNKLQKLLADVNGASFISIDTETVPVLKGGKKNPHQGRVTKISKGASVMVFQNKNSNAYENMVERRLKAEGKDPASFTLGERAWGTRITGTPFIEHKGETYLEVIFLKAPKETVFLLDGKEVDAAEIEGLEPAAVKEESQGGLENKVIIRTFKCDSIQTIRVDGLEVSRTNGKGW